MLAVWDEKGNVLVSKMPKSSRLNSSEFGTAAARVFDGTLGLKSVRSGYLEMPRTEVDGVENKKNETPKYYKMIFPRSSVIPEF